MTTWTEFPGDRQNGTFIETDGYNQIVYNMMNIHERIQVLQALYSSLMPVGSVMIWYGNVADIPEGWQLADGTNGTPDLRGKFVMGLASTDDDDDIGTSGGNTQHSHAGGTISTAWSTHSHSGGEAATSYPYGSTTGVSTTPYETTAAYYFHYHSVTAGIGNAGSHTHGSKPTNTSDHLPPYTKYYWVARIPSM